jgi:hypothetical protein
VRGYAQGGSLDVRWQGDSFDVNRSPGLLLAAALDPNGLAELILGAIEREQPLNQTQHAEKVTALRERIAELSYVEAALVERNGGEHDPQSEPMCILGVRLEERSEAAA